MKNTKTLALLPLVISGFAFMPNIAHAASTDPVTVTDNVTVPFNQNFEIKELANDNPGAGANWSKVEIQEPDGSWGTTYDDNTTMLTVNSAKNIDFSIIQGFTGKDTPITYRATNTLGKAVTGTINVTVQSAKSPKAVNDKVLVKVGTANIIDVLKNDIKGESNSPLSGVMFKDSKGNFVPELTTVDGHYFVTTDAKVSFTANSTFRGIAKQPVTYRAIDLNNNASEAILTVYTNTPTSSTINSTTSKTNTVTTPTKKAPITNNSKASNDSSGRVTLGPMVQTDYVTNNK